MRLCTLLFVTLNYRMHTAVITNHYKHWNHKRYDHCECFAISFFWTFLWNRTHNFFGICNFSIAKLSEQLPELRCKTGGLINLYSVAVVEINILMALLYIIIQIISQFSFERFKWELCFCVRNVNSGAKTKPWRIMWHLGSIKWDRSARMGSLRC